jgi:hypothetical protein
MEFLTKEIADALCTIIALGFSASEIEQRGNMIYEYDNLADEEAYNKVRDFFNALGVPIAVQQSSAQTLMPYVLGTDLPPRQRQEFIDKLIDRIGAVGKMMEKAADEGNPKGAYIGIAFTVDPETGIPVQKIDPPIYGPSALRQYPAVYRQAGDASVENAYEEAKKCTNAAVAAVAAGNGDKPAVAVPFNEPYVTGQLFGSCHGMIRAMAAHPAFTADGATVYAELALGSGTKKVSSCLPCAMFMASFGMPASSIHLGRGDNWVLPDYISAELRAAWANSIVENYRQGIIRLNPLLPFNGSSLYFNDYIRDQICKCPDGFEDEIPYIFLEALTFESSFSDKIVSTFELT